MKTMVQSGEGGDNARCLAKRLTLRSLLVAFLCLFLGCAQQTDHKLSGKFRAEHPVRLRQAPFKTQHGINPAVEERSDPYWQRAQVEVYRSSEELAAQDERERRRGQVLPKLTRGNPKEKVLALTFDDGPHPEYTQKLLDLLKSLKVKATFFVIGKMVEKRPDLLKAIDRAGHVVGNHTFSHVTLTKIPLADIETEYRANLDLVQRTIGKTMEFCRPPGGDYDADVIRAATALNMTTVLWTDDPGDYASPGNTVIKRRTLAKLSPGGIILLHDGVQETLEILPQVVEYAKKQGYRFVTVSELRASTTVK